MMEAIKFSICQGIDACCTVIMPEVLRFASIAIITLVIYSHGKGAR